MPTKTYCRWAPSLGALEDTAQNIWGTLPYNYWKHKYENLIQFGCYDLRDFLAVWLHRRKIWILWAGSDIRNLQAGFIFNDGKLKTLSRFLRGNWWVLKILKKAEHWVENIIEKEALEELGIAVTGVCPSYLGNTNLPISYKWNKVANVYVSSSINRQDEYGFPIIERIAGELPWIKFHLYGAPWSTKHSNVIVHGRITKEIMNKQIAKMQIGLRLNSFEGFSEILAKATLRGQHAIGKVPHPHIPSFENDMDLILKLNMLRHKKEPNLKVRQWYRDNLNQFPWVSH